MNEQPENVESGLEIWKRKKRITKLANSGVVCVILLLLVFFSQWWWILLPVPLVIAPVGLIINGIAFFKARKYSVPVRGRAFIGMILCALAVVYLSVMVPMGIEYEMKTDMENDISKAKDINGKVWSIYRDEDVKNDMQAYNGAKIAVTESDFAVLPASFLKEWNDSRYPYPEPYYKWNGAKYFVIEFKSEGCEAVCIYNGKDYIELFPDVDEMYDLAE